MPALPAIDMEAGVFPREQVGKAAGADMFAGAEGLQETVAEEFDHGGAAIGGHAVEAALQIAVQWECPFIKASS